MRKKSTSLAELVSRLPDPDQRGMYCTDIDKDRIEKTIAEIYKGGRKNIIGIIDMLVPPGKGDDVKPHYALHCLVLHVCKLNDANQRRVFAKTLASQLCGNRPKAVQRYLVRELQVAGVEEVTETIGKLLTDEELCEPAAQALIAIGDGAAEQLRKAFQSGNSIAIKEGASSGAASTDLTEPKVKGPSNAGSSETRRWRGRLTIIQNLGVVREGKSIGALKKALRDENREIRLAAAWALANIGPSNAGYSIPAVGGAGSVDALLKAAEAEGWERIKATKACLLMAEKLLTAGRKKEAVKIYKHLRDTRTNPAESYVRDAARGALAAISG